MSHRFKPPFVLLEDRASFEAAGRLYSRPVDVVRCDDPGALGASLDRVQAGLDRGLHAAGFLAYEAGAALEPSLAGRRMPAGVGPLLWFGLFAGFEPISGEVLDELFGELAPAAPIEDVELGHSREEHVSKVQAVKALIEAGDAYQVNLTFPIRFRYAGDPMALYAAMRARQPVAHGGVVALSDCTVLSVSPELFVSVSGGRVVTRPMKGTTARGADEAADCDARRNLVCDPKQRAENLMIVDLLRNDLSRVSRVGSVRVPALFTVETYPTFHALTSTVTGDLRADSNLRDILDALFPCGSVVGAPKIRAGEIIAELEPEGRGAYTGAVGAVGPGGDLAFNVAIRTAVLTAGGEGRFGVGGGIVADSDPDAEYDEALLKGRVLTGLADDFQLIETLRWTSAAGFVWLGEHLARMARSAGRLGFAFDPRRADAQVHETARAWRSGPDRRVRLLLHRDGLLAISDTELDGEPSRVLRVGVFGQTLDAADPFLRHKTTRRAVHEAAAAEAAGAGLDEMVLLNRRGGVADGARNSLFVEREGRLFTPPLRAGALPGILRAGLVAQGAAVEAELSLADLQARPILIGNSLRGLRWANMAEL
jgi:para-aminobenzoate synthetase / 4-amino-4-deoxychorismate lyase